VKVIDSKEFFSRVWNPSTMTTFAVQHDCCVCQDTVWVPYPILPLNNATAKDCTVYRLIETELRPREEDLLSVGTVFFPSRNMPTNLFHWPMHLIFKVNF